MTDKTQPAYLVEPSLFKRLQDRWTKARQKPKYLDEEMIPIMDGLNRIPGAVTVWSCASHPEREPSVSQLYVVVAVGTQEAFDRIVGIGMELLRRSRHQLRTELTLLTDPFDTSRDYQSDPRWYPCIMIESVVHSSDCKETALKLLSEVIG